MFREMSECLMIYVGDCSTFGINFYEEITVLKSACALVYYVYGWSEGCTVIVQDVSTVYGPRGGVVEAESEKGTDCWSIDEVLNVLTACFLASYSLHWWNMGSIHYL